MTPTLDGVPLDKVGAAATPSFPSPPPQASASACTSSGEGGVDGGDVEESSEPALAKEVAGDGNFSFV